MIFLFLKIFFTIFTKSTYDCDCDGLDQFNPLQACLYFPHKMMITYDDMRELEFTCYL